MGKLILVLIALPFVLFGVESYFSGGAGSDVAATVDDSKISKPELEQRVIEQRNSLLNKLGGNSDLIDEKALHSIVLENLITQSVAQTKAQKLGFTISDSQLIDLVHKQPTFQKDGKFSDQLFQDYLRQQKQDRNSLFKMMRDQTSVNILAQGINNTAFAGGAEVDRIMALQVEKRDVALATVLASPYLAQVNVTDANINTYYLAHKADLKSSEQANLDYIAVDSTSLSNQIKVTDADLQAQYQIVVKAAAANEQRRAEHILVATSDKVSDAAAKQKIEAIAAQIKAGADFGALAKANSDDPGSAANNGDLGLAGRGVYAPEFEQALFALQQPNQVSVPVKTQFGYHLIKLLEIKGTAAPSFDSVKMQLGTDAAKTKLDAAYSDLVNKIDEQAAGTDSIVELAKSHGLSIAKSGMIARTGGTGDFANKDLIATAFSDESIKDRKVSTGIAISPTRTIWLQTTQYEPVKSLTLAEATPRVRATLQLQGAVAMAKAKAAEIAAALNSGKTIADVSQTFVTQFQTANEVGRQGGLPTTAISQAAFGLKSPAAGQITATTVDAPSGVTVVAVTRVIAGVPVPEQKVQMQGALGSLHGQQDLEDYVEYLKGHAKIVKTVASSKSES
jgi:peptidyl-prolyl cis-trans isomerase D